MSVRVVIAEPRRSMRETFAEGLTEEVGIEVVATTEDASSTLLQVQRTHAEVVIISAGLRGPLPDLCSALRSLDTPPRTLLLDGPGDEDRLVHAIEAGADGYVSGSVGIQGVGAAVLATARGESVVPPSMLGPLLRRLIQQRRDADHAAERLDDLTRREREVLSLLVEGRGHEGIAAVLVISPETARTHVQRILRKLEVHSRGEAVALVARTGMADRLERLVERSAS
jgi:DNA-binding NarL/FixJ family response regulator